MPKLKLPTLPETNLIKQKIKNQDFNTVRVNLFPDLEKAISDALRNGRYAKVSLKTGRVID